MMRQPLDLLAEPTGIKLFYGVHDTGVDVAPAFEKHPVIGDVMGKRVRESILQVRKQLRSVEKFRGLHIVEQTAEIVLRQPADRMQEARIGRRGR